MYDDDDKWFARIVGGLGCLWLLIVVAFWATVIFIALHFAAKFW